MATVKRTLKTWLLRVLKGYRIPLAVIAGLEKSSGKEITLVTSASGAERAYLAELVYGDKYTECNCRSVWVWRLRKAALRNNADMLVHLSREGATPHCLGRRNVFRIPVWIRGEINFNVVERLKSSSKNVKRDVSRIRRNNLSYLETRDPQQFELFYSSMLIPYARNVYGKAAHTIERSEFMGKIGSSELLLIQKDGESIAGQMIIYEGGKAYCWALGVKDGDSGFVKMGALSACYVFTMQYLHKKGFEMMRVGSSKAFLKDGVLQYKSKWGMKLVGAKKPMFVLDVIKLNGGTKAFLVNNPFCQLRDREFVAEVFVDENETLTEQALLNINKLFYMPGMSRLNICRFGATGAPDVEVPGELSGHLTVQDAGSRYFGDAN